MRSQGSLHLAGLILLAWACSGHARRLSSQSQPGLLGPLNRLFRPKDIQLDKRRPDWEDDDGVTVHWALVCAGSNGWWNYRHQADVAHAYQVLRSGGLLPQRIVVMMYDDLVMDTNNPHPGQLFNRPGGPDVYRGIQVDYRGPDVNAQTFLAVLEGNKTALRGIGSGKVIASGPKDRVFVFFSDHGSPGVLGMPSGPFLYADELMGVLRRKHAAAGYREMALYIEACESGSMFEGLLGQDLPVYATTAANAQESSWGTYCPGLDLPMSEGFDTCLGDLYSVAWMEDMECEDGMVETLGAQFDLVRARTSNNFTYNMGSHVMAYGRVQAMRCEHTGDYMGYRDASACMLQPQGQAKAPTQDVTAALSSHQGASRDRQAGPRLQRHHRRHAALQQHEADLVPLRVAVSRAANPQAQQAAQAALTAEVSRREAVDRGVGRAVEYLLTAHTSSSRLLSALGSPAEVVFGAQQRHAAGDNRLAPQPQYVQQLSRQPVGRRPAGSPLVDDWDCLRGMVAAYEQICGRMDQYQMRHTRLMANLCNAGVPAAELAHALQAVAACPPAATKATLIAAKSVTAVV